MKMTFQEIRIIATGPCITNQLRDVNTICYRYIDDVLSINNSRFAEFLSLIYPPQIPFGPHHFWTYASNLTAVVKSVLKFMINGTTVACFSDEDDVSGNQNNCYWPLHNESIARCKHHMQEKLVYCCTCLENIVRKVDIQWTIMYAKASHTGILMTFYLSIILDLQNFFHWYILALA
jgi:hypothetical protein